MLIGLPVAPDLEAGDVARVVSALELGVAPEQVRPQTGTCGSQSPPAVRGC